MLVSLELPSLGCIVSSLVTSHPQVFLICVEKLLKRQYLSHRSLIISATRAHGVIALLLCNIIALFIVRFLEAQLLWNDAIVHLVVNCASCFVVSPGDQSILSCLCLGFQKLETPSEILL